MDIIGWLSSVTYKSFFQSLDLIANVNAAKLLTGKKVHTEP